MKRQVLRSVALLAFLAVLLAPSAETLASGYANIGGYAGTSGVTFYHTHRWVTYPPTAGPEVAFYQDSGPAGLFLGTHDCNDGGGGPMYKQAIGSWQPVAYYSSAPTLFCILTSSNSGSGNFNGDLSWD